MQLKGAAGGLPVLAVASRGLDGLLADGDESDPGSPSKVRRGGRRSRRLLQAAAALLAVWLCCVLLAPAESVQLQQGVASLAAAGDRTAAAVGGAVTNGSAAAAGGAADSAVWPTSDDIQAQELEARRAFLRQQQAVRHQLAVQRAAAAARPHTGFLPQPPPKVALMFLVRGNMPQEPVWRSFFEAAGQIEPVAVPPPFAQLAQGRQQRQLSAKYSGAAGPQKSSEGISPTSRLLQQQQQLQQRMQLPAEDVLAEGAAPGFDLPLGKAGKGRRSTSWHMAQLDFQRLPGQPVTPEQQEQLEANQALEEALGQGEHAQHAQQQALRSRSMEAPLSMLSPVDPDGVIGRQDLFSVYVHTMPGFYYGNGSIFSGYQIDRRVFVTWGQYTVAEAERRLIISALSDQRNQRFILIRQTCTPLYPPHVVYLQLLSDTKSRVNACANTDGSMVERWNAALYMPGLLIPDKWRKSTQWKSLTRAHAELVAADRHLAPRFERECYSYLPPVMVRPAYVVAQNRTWVHRSCISDEHYIPTLLAIHGRDQETTCYDALTAADWVTGLWSPVVHHAEDINPDLIRRLRKQRATDLDCSAAEAIASAKTMFRRHGASITLAGGPLPGSIRAGASSAEGGTSTSRRSLQRQVPSDEQQLEQRGDGYARLHQACFLLARKFAPDTAQLLLHMSQDCQQGTALSPKCLGE
ncbi:hypothetical protein ABPG75_002716 [Micractinium tetrahymenae]